jgi:hypothetical protein
MDDLGPGILVGLVGLGILLKTNQNKNTENTTIEKVVPVPKDDNIYTSDHYKKVDEDVIRQIADNIWR